MTARLSPIESDILARLVQGGQQLRLEKEAGGYVVNVEGRHKRRYQSEDDPALQLMAFNGVMRLSQLGLIEMHNNHTFTSTAAGEMAALTLTVMEGK